MGGANTGEPSEPPASPAPVAPQTLYVNANTGDDDKGDGTETNPYKTVVKALEQTTEDGTYTIYLGAGEYYSYETKVAEGKNLTLTFIGAGTDKTIWKMGTSEAGKDGEDGDYSLQGNDKVTFENMTLLSSVTPSGNTVNRDYTGFIRIKNFVVKNCVIDGKLTYGGTSTSTYENVIFNAPNGDYSFHSIDSDTISFKGCTFNGSGKFINVYKHWVSGDKTITVNYDSCTVNATAANKQPLNIKNHDSTNDTKNTVNWIINITGENKIIYPDTIEAVYPDGSTEHGQVNKTTCSRLFAVQTGNGEHDKLVTVNIDSTPVWKDGKMVSHAIDTTNDKYTDGYKDDAFIVKEEGNTVTKTCQYCGWTESYTKQDWNIIVSKTATNLDKDAKGDYKTDVTLSVPGIEENLNSDVVFVLDTSDCVGSVMEHVRTLVERLNALSSEKKVNIKVGVVAFKGSAAAMFGGNLVSVDEAVSGLNTMINAVDKATDKEAAVLSYLNGEDFIKKGSNLHSGLLAAQKLLDGDEEVDNDRKYLITVTDALTYYWNDDQGNVYGIYDEMHPDFGGKTQLLFEVWGPAFGVNTSNEINTWCIYDNSPVNDWDNYINNVRSRIANDNGNYDTNVRDAISKLNATESSVRSSTITDLNNNGFKYISYYSEPDEHAHGIERSIVACIDTYKQLVNSDYNCYVVNSKPQYELSGLVTSELNKLAGQNATIDFDTIENKILYAVGKGSYVKDVIGDKFELFDLKPDHTGYSSLKLHVGEKELTNSFILANVENGDFTVYYYADGFDTNTLVNKETNSVDEGKLEQNYRFKVDYDAASKTLTWTFNEAVSNFDPVQLSYTLKLTKPKTAPGTYGQLDLKGDGYIDGKDTITQVDPLKALYTNNNATLTPVDSNGNEGVKKDFPMPSVEYTVKNPYRPPVNPGIGDEITVEITGNSDSVVYDGTEHSVKGYTVKISDPRYTEADFTFTGKAEASGVNAGTYEMGLKAEQFKNTNARFTNVKFVIKADGVLTITPKELTITAGSKTEYGPTPVTCGEWTVSGLAAGDKVESVKITGIQSVPGSSPNVPSDAVIKNAKGEDVTKNYAIKYVNGTLTMLEVLNKEDHFNYIIGTPEGLSLPTANVTRAEVATIFFRLMTDDARAKFDSLDNNFSDVAKGKWYNRAISTLANAGIIKGDPAGTYRPGDPITRAEMAAIIARFGDFKEGGKTFNDISGHWAQKYIELAASNGWINGNPDGTFKPNNNITRAETVAMINRVLDRQTKDVSDLLPVAQMTNWSDNMDTAKWYYRDMQEATNNHKAERVGDSIYEKWTEKLPDIDWASYQI